MLIVYYVICISSLVLLELVTDGWWCTGGVVNYVESSFLQPYG